MRKLLSLALALAALLGASNRCQAIPFTNYLDYASNAIAQAYDATASMPRAHAVLGRALADVRDTNRVSTNVSGDYAIYVRMCTHLLPMFNQPGTEEIGVGITNAFISFFTEAQVEAYVLNARLADVTPFQPLRRVASNTVAQAQRALRTATNSANVQVRLLSMQLAYVKLAVASRLTERAEKNQGFAPDVITGAGFTHTNRAEVGNIFFIDETHFADYGPDENGTPPPPATGTYEWTRTGLNTGKLILHQDNPNAATGTYLLRFTSEVKGSISFREQPASGRARAGRMTFHVIEPT